MDNEKTYNGWANYDTWNVSLWLNNDYGLYSLMLEYVKEAKNPTYIGLAEMLTYELECYGTEDGTKWLSRSLDTDALDDMIWEIKDGNY